MWPGQQAGGDQHPQQQNPYQQPVPSPQPGPYQQPGQAPYQQPATGGWGAPEQPGAAPTPPEPGGKEPMSTNAVVAMIAAFALVAAAAVVGVIVVNNRGDGGTPAAKKESPSASPKPTGEGPTTAPSADPENPRGQSVEPVVAGWKAVANRKRHNAFDVPPEWKVESAGLTTGFEADDGSGKVLVAMTGVATYKDDWCGSASRAMAGTKGAVGAKNTKEAAENTASSWIVAAYDQKLKGTLKTPDATAFTNKNGVSGHIARASVSGVPKKKSDEGCLNTDGKAVSVSFKDKDGAMASFVVISDTGVPDEIPDSVIDKIVGSLRLI
ncbi:hypothetical protein SRB5_07100 [Streptomyces sp. RB5]|uniref:DUF8017 domain-containing protein n=1 Tax=Streptomyces smaragdinus TaxID=2585196 RepID=A0A7K0CAY2_9ACTN|nr:hypothetical protein [Streptomyces smaragdinus]MQY10599.1 hypothetical protein [Streptomyces smaragdinus]